MSPRFTIVVPAHNEARLLPGGLAAIGLAARRVGGEVEVVVVANRCTDETAEIARRAGAVVVEDSSRNLSMVRNAGVAAGTGDIVVTLDADCRMHPDSLIAIERALATGRFVGGAVRVVPERTSPGIRATYALLAVVIALTRLGGGLFWCRRADFDAIGGFDEGVLVGEDLDFARRLRRHGRATGRRFTTLPGVDLVASCRKFDRYGDWHMFTMARDLPAIRRAARGTDPTWLDRYFFDFNPDPPGRSGTSG
jgi:glycosyltransferase involved in cell wall biosynthesis